MVRLFGPISGPLHGAMVWASFRMLTLVHLFEPIYGLYIGLADLWTFTMVHLFEPNSMDLYLVQLFGLILGR